MSQQEKDLAARFYVELFKTVFIDIGSKYNTEHESPFDDPDHVLVEVFKERTGYPYKSNMFQLFWAFVRGLDMASFIASITEQEYEDVDMADALL